MNNKKRNQNEVKMLTSKSNEPTMPDTDTSPNGVNAFVDSNTELISQSPSSKNNEETRCGIHLIRGLLLCQLTSVFICGTAVFSNLLVEAGVNVPTLQSFGNYFCLSLVYATTYVYKTPTADLKARLKSSWWKYFIVAAFDVEGNYLMVKAYQYTSITSVQLLDSVTIPVVLILSWIVLKYRYRWIHFGGVVIALAGMGIMIYADVSQTTSRVNSSSLANATSDSISRYFSGPAENATSSRAWLGDVLAVLGAGCYGFSNVGQEYFVRSAGQWELLAMIGFFGAFINGAQFCVLELDEAGLILGRSGAVYAYIFGFNVCLFCIYSIVPKSLKWTSAAVFNISILTSDFYTFMFGLLLFQLPINPLYFVAYVLVICGITIYSIRSVPNVDNG